MKIKTSDYRKVFACGDIHGQLEFLLLALKELGYDEEQDLIITMGDMIDRGDDSLGTLLYFLDSKPNKKGLPKAISTRGNHEDFAIDIFVEGNNSYKADWFKHGGLWSESHDDKLLTDIFTRVKEELPLHLSILYKDKHIVASHAAIPGYRYSNIDEHPDKRLMKDWLIHKPEDLPVDEEDDFSNFEVTGADLTIHGHNMVPEPYLFKNRLYIDTGCFKDSGIDEGVSHSLTLLTISDIDGISISSFKKNSFLEGIEWVDNEVNEKEMEKNLTALLS